jgi:pyrimidine-nucleoside phosphorylase
MKTNEELRLMRIIDCIDKKVEKLPLTTEEIRFVVEGYTNGRIPDEQMAALLMAIRINGMNDRETADLTYAMMHSGDIVDLSDVAGIKVDKHSTGGVGDTTTLVVAPLVAACGGVVAKMSGRGLSFTGGTIDKLESFPGLKVEQTSDRFRSIVNDIGVAVIGQSGNLVPADKLIYALRDVTGTVRSIPLIASSIMSKKLAAGSDAIVLDVKTGNGAFMRTTDEAIDLARLMVALGKHLDRSVTAVVTDMAIGNALEVREAIELLSNRIAPEDPLYRLCLTLGAEMLILSGLAQNSETAETRLQEAIVSGAGLAKFKAMVKAMGGDDRYCDPAQINELCKTLKKVTVPAGKSGVVQGMDTEELGKAAQILGAGRERKEDPIDPAVGIVMRVRVGDSVSLDTPLCTLYVNDDTNEQDSINRIINAVQIGSTPPDKFPLVYKIIRGEDV